MSESTEVLNLLQNLYPDDPRKWAEWLTTTNSYLQKQTPADVMKLHQGVLVLTLLHRMISGTMPEERPGATK